jgi:hypothetical protein
MTKYATTDCLFVKPSKKGSTTRITV